MVPDSTLLKSYCSGHLPSFETLYDRYKNGLFTYILGRVKQNEVAEELLQEVFISFIGRVKELKETGSLRFYLYTSARNRVIDYFRKEKRQISVSGQVEDIKLRVKVSPLNDLIKKEEVRESWNTVFSLPETQREIVLLKIMGQMTLEEISNMTQIPKGTVASRYRLGLEKLTDIRHQKSNSDT